MSAPLIEDYPLEELADKLFRERGFDLHSYKPRLLKRRLTARLRLCSCGGVKDYLDFLRSNPGEVDELLKALDINVSGFFRNAETFDFLAERILPGLIRRNRESGRGLFMVSAGCADGEEPYSMAMILKGRFSRDLRGMVTRLVGMDVSGESIERAKKGLYRNDRLSETPAEYVKKYFIKKGSDFEICPEVREMVEFERRDLREGLPFSGVDLLLCRNVLIYFQKERQDALVKSFLEGLYPGGYLVLGKTESLIGNKREGFKVVDISQHVYCKAGEEPCGWR